MFAVLSEDLLGGIFRVRLASGDSLESIVDSAIDQMRLTLSQITSLTESQSEERLAIVRKALLESRYGLVNGLIQGWRPKWELKPDAVGLENAKPELSFPLSEGFASVEDIAFLLREGWTPRDMGANMVALLTASNFDFGTLPDELRSLPRETPSEDDLNFYRSHFNTA